MIETTQTGASRRPFGLRLRITLIFFAIGTLLSVAVTFSTYQIMEANLIEQLRNRVGDFAKIGALSVDRDALGRLVDEMAPNLGPTASMKIERSADYRLLSRELNRIRSANPNLIRYVYIFAAPSGPRDARYVVDADVLRLLQLRSAGRKISDEQISGFDTPFDVTGFPDARAVLDHHVPMVERTFTYDPVFKVSSISGYAPIFDSSGKKMLAVLGLDMVDSDVHEALVSTTHRLILVGVIAVALSLLASILFGTLFSRGVLELESVVKRFSDQDRSVRYKVASNDEIGSLGASFNKMADAIEGSSTQFRGLLEAYGRFVPHDFLRVLEKESVVDVNLGDQVQREMTILFSDIRGFTELSEAMTPRENFNFINSYLSRMGPEIRAHRGFIDKYIGDAIMALFPERPDNALKAAIAMQVKLREYNGHRASVGYRAVDIGIGIHTGSLMLGTIGEQERMDGSVIADAVNLCSRLEALTRVYGGTLLVSGQTVARLDNKSAFSYRFIDRVRVRGRTESVLIYEIFDGDPEALRRLKQSTRNVWNEAVERYYARDFEGALKLLEELRKASPSDRIVDIYRDRCTRFVRDGAPAGWDGIEVIDLK